MNLKRQHHSRRQVRAFFPLIVLAYTFQVDAFDGRLTDMTGTPISDVHVTVAGRTGSVRTDIQGRFRILPDPELPATLIVVGGRGEVFPPLMIRSISEGTNEVRVDHLFQDNITVTSGAAPNIDAPPAAATVLIGAESLEERVPEHLADALVGVAGVSRRGEGAPTVPVVRGLAGGRTLVMLDDTRVTAERRAGPSATFLDPFTLGSIEIARGPGSVAYGSDAFGGVIHARSRDPILGRSQLRYELSSAVGASGLHSGGIEYSQSLTPMSSLSAQVHVRDSDGSESADGDAIDNSSYEDRGGALRYVVNTTSGVFRASLALDQARDVGAPAADSLVTRTYYPEEDSRRLTASWETLSAGLSSFEIRSSISTYDIVTTRERLPLTTIPRQISSSEVAADDASLRAIFTRVGTKGRFRAGTDMTSRFNLRATGETRNFNVEDLPTTRVTDISIDDARKTDTGLFALYDWMAFQRLSASAGIRADFLAVRNRGGYFGDRSRTDTAWSGHAAITARLAAMLTLTMQGARGFRDPTLSDRYFRGVSGRGFVIGNPDLDPERSTQFDGALRWRHGRQSMALLGYHYSINDLVERYRAGADFQFRNRGRAEVKGLEIELASELPRGLALQISGAFARGEATDDNTPLDDIAAPSFHAALQWGGRRGSAFIHLLVVGEDDRPGPVEVRRDGYATADIGVGWSLGPAAKLRLQVRNAFNENHPGSADANAAPAAGRFVTIGVGGTLF